MSPDLDDLFFAVIEITALLLIRHQAWIWTDCAVVVSVSE